MLKAGDEVLNTQSSVSLLDLIGKVIFGKGEAAKKAE